MRSALLLAFGLACAGPPAAAPVPPVVVFTSKVDEDFRPVDQLERARLADGSVSIFLRWFDLGTGGDRQYRCEIRDGSSQLVSLSKMTLHPDRTTWETRTEYDFRSAIDAPGTWTFRVFIDGQLRADASLEVTAE